MNIALKENLFNKEKKLILDKFTLKAGPRRQKRSSVLPSKRAVDRDGGREDMCDELHGSVSFKANHLTSFLLPNLPTKQQAPEAIIVYGLKSN